MLDGEYPNYAGHRYLIAFCMLTKDTSYATTPTGIISLRRQTFPAYSALNADWHGTSAPSGSINPQEGMIHILMLKSSVDQPFSQKHSEMLMKKNMKTKKTL